MSCFKTPTKREGNAMKYSVPVLTKYLCKWEN